MTVAIGSCIAAMGSEHANQVWHRLPETSSQGCPTAPAHAGDYSEGSSNVL